MAQSYLNRKQEIFSKFLAEGCTQYDAYVNAGYEPSSANASTLANKAMIKARVAELRVEIEEREMNFRILHEQASRAPDPEAAIRLNAEWTFQRVMDMMGENVRLAQIAGEYKAANECLKLMGEAMKMFEKANNDQGKSSGTQNTLALIGRVVQQLDGPGADSDPLEQNTLRPRLGSTG